jgi:hypothetical protein
MQHTGELKQILKSLSIMEHTVQWGKRENKQLDLISMKMRLVLGLNEVLFI